MQMIQMKTKKLTEVLPLALRQIRERKILTEPQLKPLQKSCSNMLKFKMIDRKTPEQMQKIKSYAKDPKGFLLLAGDNGTGKSFVAEAIYELRTPFQLPQYDMDIAFFINQSDLNTRWKHDVIENSALELLERLKNTKLLVLDDLGTKPPTDAFGDFLYSIIDYRWNRRKELGTIITTNMTATIVREKFGDAILSRIASGTNIRFTRELNGDDRRIIDF